MMPKNPSEELEPFNTEKPKNGPNYDTNFETQREQQKLNFSSIDEEGNYQSLDDVLERVGGCGRYQVLWMTVIILGMTSGAFINYTLNYLELEPQYLC